MNFSCSPDWQLLPRYVYSLVSPLDVTVMAIGICIIIDV
jgi:hypothetical protein